MELCKGKAEDLRFGEEEENQRDFEKRKKKKLLVKMIRAKIEEKVEDDLGKL